MISISVCMIVKNEGKILGRCLDSLKGIADEIIVVDTGSTDNTKEIASKYTDKVFDFKWVDDFSAARNYSFSKATKDYIYVADADEVLDEENRKSFMLLKSALLPEIDIVQMLYVTKTPFNTVLNSSKELRPKLYKRLRTFTWQDPIHETIRLTPIIYDSEIEVTHLPENLHSKRDFSIFVKTWKRDKYLSDNSIRMYAKELFKTGDTQDFAEALDIFETLYESGRESVMDEVCCVICKAYLLMGDSESFLQYAIHNLVKHACSEICYCLGIFYYQHKGNHKEALTWFYNAAFETEAILDIHTCGDLALKGLYECNQLLSIEERKNGNDTVAELYAEEAHKYEDLYNSWDIPEEI